MMKTLKLVAGLLFCAVAGQVSAQELNASETTTSINTQNHSTSVAFTPGGTGTNSFDFQLNYDPALLTFDNITSSSPLIGCSNPMAGQILCIANAGIAGGMLAALPASTITIVFDVGGTAGTSVLDIANVTMTDTAGNPQMPTIDDGEVVINVGPVPEFTGNPAAPGPITINGAVGADGTGTITVTNTGDVGSTLTVTAAAADAGAGTLSVAPTAMQSIAQGGAGQTYTLTCSAPAAENFTGTVTFTTNDSDEGTVVYNVNCNIAAAPAPEYSSVPAAGSTITINDAVGGGGTTDTVVVTNAGTANLTATATGLSGVLAVAPTGQQTIAPAASQTFTITCTATSAGPTMQTLNIASNDADEASNDYTVICNGVAPEFSSAPAAGSTITIVDVAGDGMPSSGSVVVTNTGTGDLLVTAAVTAGFTVAPTGQQTIAPAGMQTFTVSCNSTDAVNTNGTLTLTTNDADEGTNTYTLVCDATGAEVGTTPASGSTISVSGAPATPVAASATVTNTGDAALTISGCMLGGTNPGSFTTPADQTIAAGGSGTLTSTCTAPAAGTVVTATLTCNTNDLSEPTITFNLSCQGLNVSIPTLGDFGKLMMIAMVLGLGLLGLALRRTA